MDSSGVRETEGDGEGEGGGDWEGRGEWINRNGTATLRWQYRSEISTKVDVSG